MQRARILLFLGIWIVVLPYLGFPYSWKDVFTILSGLGVIYVSYRLYKESKVKETKEARTFDNFRENKFEESGEEKSE
jgi:hypothetical protein